MDESQPRGVQVSAVHLRLGALCGVVKDAPLFSYEVACQDPPLQGSQLIVEDMPVIVLCAQCRTRGNSSQCSCFTVRSAARRPWTCVKAKNLKYLRGRSRNERAASGRSPQERLEVERRDRALCAREPVPRGGSVCGELGFESGLGEGDFSGEDAHPTCSLAIESPRWSVTWQPRTTPCAWHAARRR
ncbi:MAG TPA: hydrogenase maturation nickel metallochaperone HypA [Candidatus Sulfotelmatobacter sp.]